MLDCVIDVSDAQGKIDYAAVASTGIVVAFVKATEGATFAARTFAVNRDGFTAAGVRVVPYDFLRPGYAQAQYDHFRQVAGLGAGSVCMIDWEGRAADTCTAAVAEEIGSDLAALCGRDPVGYWGIDGSTPAPPTDKMRSWPRFVPRYPKSGARSFADLATTIVATTWPGAMFAQYTCWGQVPGITGNVDRSIWLGTRDELDAWLATGALPSWAARSFGGVSIPTVLSAPLKRGSTGPLVREAQDRLAARGFGVGSSGPDGIFGGDTEAAAAKFRASVGLPAGKVLDQVAWTALFS